MSLIGLDIGTTGCKAIVFDEGGSILGQTSREYAILTPRPNWVEQDADQVWGLAWDALSEAVAQAREDPPQALALSVAGRPYKGPGEAKLPAFLSFRCLGGHGDCSKDSG